MIPTIRRQARPPAAGFAHAVRDRVDQTLDPALGEPLGEYGLVTGVDVHRGGRVVVQVAGLAGDTYADQLRKILTTAVASVPGVEHVHVDVTRLDEAARSVLAHRLRHDRTQPGGLGSPTSVYAIGSGKGGVGKSSLTANLAVALARSGKRVGVLDADVWGFSMPQIFGTREQPVALPGIMLPVPAHGVRLMSMGFFVSDEQPVVWRGPMLQKALEQFLDDVYWGSLDTLLIDLPPGTGDVPLTIMELLPGAALIVVTTPQKAAVQVAARAGRMALDARMPIAGVVENMSGAAFGSGGGTELAAALGTRLLAQVPLDERLREAGDDGIPVVTKSPEAPSAVSIWSLATSLPVVRPSLAGKSLPLFVTSTN